MQVPSVEQLAAKLNRPPTSLAAFGRLSEDQLRTLTDAIEATCEHRRQQIDAELERALPDPVVKLLRGPGIPPLRRALIR